MIDQASELRKLVLQSVRQQVAAAGPSPRLIVVASGKGGVGVTTTAVNLSVALAEHGWRVVVIDANSSDSGVADLCGLSEEHGVRDVLVARRDIHEVLRRGPAGIQVVPGLCAPGGESEWTETAQGRLLRQLNTLGRHADVVILDAGGGSGDFLRRFCQAADDILFVTTADTMAVMDTYARVKTSLSDLDVLCLDLVVNMCDAASESRDVHHRIDQSCQRFLGHRVDLLATIPSDAQVPASAQSSSPFVIGSPRCPAARAIAHLASAILKRPARARRPSRGAA